MRRRDIIAGLLVAAGLMAPSAGTTICAQAQPTATKIPRIGYLGTNIGPASLPPIEAFREALRQLGYIEGQNIVVEYRWASGQADQLAAAKTAELVRLNLDLIVAANTTYIPYEQHKVAMPPIEAAAQKLAVTLQLVPASTADEFDAAFTAMDREHAEAVVALGSSLTYSHRARRPCARAPSAEHHGWWLWRPLELLA